MPIQAKILAGFVIAIISGIGLWNLYHAGYQAGKNEIQVQWDADKIKRDEAERVALLAYAERIKEGQAQHDEDQAIINKLHAADRVRIHLPTCNDTKTNPDQDGTAGPLPERVDQVFADFETRVGELMMRCDQLNIDAIRANGQ